MDTQSKATQRINEAAKIVWKQMGYDDNKPPEVTPDKLRQWMPQISHDELMPFQGRHFASCAEIPKDDESGNWIEIAWYRLLRCQQQHADKIPTQTAVVRSPTKLLPLDPEILIPTKIRNKEEIKARIITNPAMIAILCGWNGEKELYYFKKNAGISSLEDGVIAIHNLWDFCNEKYKGEFYHPLEPIVEAYLKEITAKHITPEYDRKNPAAILKSGTMGSIKDINLVDTDTVARLREFATPESITQVERQQLLDAEQAPQTVLPDVMCLEIASPLGIIPKTRKGAVSHTLRIFYEALMALEPNQTQEIISFTLRNLIDYLYPNGKFNRTNQLPYILDALGILHFYATVPYEIESGRFGKWRPVVVRNALDGNSKYNDKIFLDVRLPPDATQGMLVEKQILRLLGQQSAPQFSAYLSACTIFDKYGTVKGSIIDPTRPKVNRNTEGYIVDVDGNELHKRGGKRIKNLYNSDAIAQLEREPNPNREKYPILSNSDLIKACNLQNLSQQSLALTRARKYWKELENEDIVRIERFREGWRIMPSDHHIEVYRAIVKAIKMSK